MTVKMKRVLVFGLCIVLMVVLLAGCGASKSSKDEATNQAAEGAYAGKADMSVSNGVNVKFDEPINVSAVSVGLKNVETKSTNVSSSAASNNYSKKVIKNADVSLEVKNADNSLTDITKWVNSNGGYEFSRNVSVKGNYKNVSMVFKIQPDKLNDFLSYLEGAGKVLSSNSTGNDITDQYYDSSARLESLKAGRDQFLQIMKNAKTIDETLKVQNELNKINSEIESLEGRLKMWDKQVDESTVTLRISEENDPLKPSKEVSWKFSSPGDIANTIKNGFILMANTIINLLVWLIIIVVASTPVTIPCAIIVYVILRLRKKKMLERAKSIVEVTPSEDNNQG